MKTLQSTSPAQNRIKVEQKLQMKQDKRIPTPVLQKQVEEIKKQSTSRILVLISHEMRDILNAEKSSDPTDYTQCTCGLVLPTSSIRVLIFLELGVAPPNENKPTSS